jgi:hypothetical protein
VISRIAPTTTVRVYPRKNDLPGELSTRASDQTPACFSKSRTGPTKDRTLVDFAREHDCEACTLKPQCCPNMPARNIARSIHEAARDKARAIAKIEAYVVSRRSASGGNFESLASFSIAASENISPLDTLRSPESNISGPRLKLILQASRVSH